jgi:multifunctional methyltransferase subunit TRM112
MRLLTHNMLACNIKGVTKGFPLGIEVTKLETKESAMNADFLRHIYPKLDWKALHDAAHTLGLDDIPEQVEPAMLEDEDFLQKFHHALLEVHLEEGALICPETNRRFPVTKGVPNMLLNEDEV